MNDGPGSVTDVGDPSLDVSGGGGRVRLDLGYDGTCFFGWAVQPGRRTVQGVLQDALSTIVRAPVALTVAGRTDAGVHASAQVSHADLPRIDLPALLRSLRGVLPPDVRVHRVTWVPPTFDARFSALWRRYEYRIADGAAGVDPLRRAYVAAWRRPLDVDAMSRAAAGLVGEHDFAAFCRRRPGGTTIRSLHLLEVERSAEEIVVVAQADAFCHSMVRSVVGALTAVGEGRRGPGWPASLLSRQDRADDIAVAPAHGLVLVEVAYPPDADLAARAALTREKRGPVAGA